MKKAKSEPELVRPQRALFELTPPPPSTEPELRAPQRPVWTDKKASLIALYLRYFVFVTKHGTYIDGFAGPQTGTPEMWAAKLVLESRPRWLRQFYLFDQKRRQVAHLRKMVAAQPARENKEPKRTVSVRQGDFNAEVKKLLASGCVRETEATFCLLDQRTFECSWATLEALARHKMLGNKIEIFYFFPEGWLDRAFSGVKLPETAKTVEEWWGQNDLAGLRKRGGWERAIFVANRLKTEFGYKSVKPWPIFEREDGGKVMYFMIHATDHPDAPVLMRRAYDRAVLPPESFRQLQRELKLDLSAVKT